MSRSKTITMDNVSGYQLKWLIYQAGAATLEEQLMPAYHIRTAVFIQEQGFQNEFDSIDLFAEHLVVLYQQSPVATGRLYEDAQEKYLFHLGRIAVLSPYRKLGLGRLVVQALERRAMQRHAQCIVLSAQVRAMEFYQKLGYHPQGSQYFEEHCAHMKMVKQIHKKNSEYAGCP